MELQKQDVAEALRLTVPSLVEECLSDSHLKGHFKRFRMDFYKPEGKSIGSE